MAVTNGKAVKERPEMAADRVSSQELLRAYRTMVLSRKLDDKEIQLKNQSLIFFQISGAGHEAILTAAGMALKPAYDWFFPYYRDRALCLMLGMTPLEMLLAGVAAKDDPSSGGRQMPSHWGHKRLNIVSQSSPTGTQCLHAIGAAEAGRMFERIAEIDGREQHFHGDEVVYFSVGEGATSEGEFWERSAPPARSSCRSLCWSKTTATRSPCPSKCRRRRRHLEDRLPLSRPSRAEHRRHRFHRELPAMTKAVEYARARKGPALVHAKVIRPYSHSLSDDERLYKTAEERAAEATRDPIVRFGSSSRPKASRPKAELERDRREVEAEVNAAADQAIAAEKPSRDTVAAVRLLSRRRSLVGEFGTEAMPEGRPDTMVAAINRTLKDEMARNPRIVVFGEDVADCTRESAWRPSRARAASSR